MAWNNRAAYKAICWLLLMELFLAPAPIAFAAIDSTTQSILAAIKKEKDPPAQRLGALKKLPDHALLIPEVQQTLLDLVLAPETPFPLRELAVERLKLAPESLYDLQKDLIPALSASLAEGAGSPMLIALCLKLLKDAISKRLSQINDFEFLLQLFNDLKNAELWFAKLEGEPNQKYLDEVILSYMEIFAAFEDRQQMRFDGTPLVVGHPNREDLGGDLFYDYDLKAVPSIAWVSAVLLTILGADDDEVPGLAGSLEVRRPLELGGQTVRITKDNLSGRVGTTPVAPEPPKAKKEEVVETKPVPAPAPAPKATKPTPPPAEKVPTKSVAPPPPPPPAVEKSLPPVTAARPTVEKFEAPKVKVPEWQAVYDRVAKTSNGESYRVQNVALLTPFISKDESLQELIALLLAVEDSAPLREAITTLLENCESLYSGAIDVLTETAGHEGTASGALAKRILQSKNYLPPDPVVSATTEVQEPRVPVSKVAEVTLPPAPAPPKPAVEPTQAAQRRGRFAERRRAPTAATPLTEVLPPSGPLRDVATEEFADARFPLGRRLAQGLRLLHSSRYRRLNERQLWKISKVVTTRNIARYKSIEDVELRRLGMKLLLRSANALRRAKWVPEMIGYAKSHPDPGVRLGATRLESYLQKRTPWTYLRAFIRLPANLYHACGNLADVTGAICYRNNLVTDLERSAGMNEKNTIVPAGPAIPMAKTPDEATAAPVSKAYTAEGSLNDFTDPKQEISVRLAQGIRALEKARLLGHLGNDYQIAEVAALLEKVPQTEDEEAMLTPEDRALLRIAAMYLVTAMKHITELGENDPTRRDFMVAVENLRKSPEPVLHFAGVELHHYMRQGKANLIGLARSVILVIDNSVMSFGAGLLGLMKDDRLYREFEYSCSEEISLQMEAKTLKESAPTPQAPRANGNGGAGRKKLRPRRS